MMPKSILRIHGLRFGLAVALALNCLPSLSAAVPNLVHILAVDPSASEEGSRPAVFAVVRSGPTHDPLAIAYRVGGTASNGVDYESLSGKVVIPAGATRARIVVTPIDDSEVEGTETVVIRLEQPLDSPVPYLVCWPGVAVAQIQDNDRNATNHSPRVALLDPPDGAVFRAPADIVLIARAADPDGRVHHVEFFAGKRSLGVVTNPPPVPIVTVTSSAADATADWELDPDLFPDITSLPAPLAEGDPTLVRLPLFRLRWEDAPAGDFVLTAVATDNDGASATSDPVRIQVTDSPLRTIVDVIAVDPVASEGDPDATTDRPNTATFVVHRFGETNVPITVFYRMTGTASNGVDYQLLPGTVTIPAGARRAPVMVVPIDDTLVEGVETVVMTVETPICPDIFPPPPSCYLVGRHAAALAIIRDNDREPTNHAPAVDIVRPLDGSVFLDAADILIVADARDRDGNVVSVEFFEGTNSLGVVSNEVAILDPARPQFSLSWSNVLPGHYVLHALATDDEGAETRSRPVEISVLDRVAPQVVSVEAIDSEASEGAVSNVINTGTFRISRTGLTAEMLTVSYNLGGTADNGIDYRRLPEWAIIPAGASSTDVIVAPIDDSIVEGPETVILNLNLTDCLFPRLAPNCYRVSTNNRAVVVIRDNDSSDTNHPPRIALTQPAAGEVFEAPADIDLVASARDPDGVVRFVEFFANGESIGVVSNRPSIIPEPRPIPLGVLFPLFHLGWSNVPPGVYALTAAATDNDGATTVSEPVRIKVIVPMASVVTIVASDPYAAEGPRVFDPALAPPRLNLGRTGAFTVHRTGPARLPLLVYYSLSGTASNGTDYKALSGTVTIPAGADATEITVDPIDDSLIEGTETVVATLEPIACPAIFPPPPGCYTVGEPNRAVVFIADNDGNHSPNVEIARPNEGDSFAAHSDIEITAVTLDPDGYVPKVEFFAGTNKIGEEVRIFIIAPPPGQSERFSLTWSNVPAGEYSLTVRATDDLGAISVSAPVRIRVIGEGRVPTVTVETIDKIATEHNPLLAIAADVAVFSVNRRGNTASALDVHYRMSGAASNGIDYHFLSGVVTIPAGATSAPVVVNPIDDKEVEGTESVVITLEASDCSSSNATLAGCYFVGDPARAEAVIRDNDRAATNLPPVIRLTTPYDGQSFIAPAEIAIVARGMDPDGYITHVEFFANSNSIGSETINYIVAPPPGQPQQFSLRWSNVMVGTYRLTVAATDDQGATTLSAPVDIVVQKPPVRPEVNIVAIDPFAREGKGTNTAVFRIRRNADTNAPLTVFYAIRGTASNGVDYAQLSGQATIPAGRYGVRVVVDPIDDKKPEPIETVVLRLVQPPLANPLPAPYTIGRPAVAAAIIVDNDRPRPPSIRLEDGLIHLCQPSTPGFCFRLEASADLRHWEPLFTSVVLEDCIEFVDPEASEHPVRFLRAVETIPEYDEE